MTAAGATRERLAVEAELARRGWPWVPGPASADLVVFAGTPVPVRGDDWAERVWLGVPAPKARVAVTDARHAAHDLDHGHAALLKPATDQRAHETGNVEAGRDYDRGAHEPGTHGHDEGHEDRSTHGGMDGHHAHHMGAVAGLPMAERADDRDGLRLDRLHVPLGPALPNWPAGLMLRVELQGDVVQRAEIEPVSAPSSSQPVFWSEPWLRAMAGEPVTVGEAARRRCAAHLDSVGRFLGVAGWGATTAKARHIRDRALDDAPTTELRPTVRSLVRCVRRSWTLRWLTAGVGELSVEHAHDHQVTGPALLADGDVHSRLTAWLDEIERALDEIDERAPLANHPPVGPRGRVDADVPPSQALLDVLPGLLEGAEFACARLIVASLDPDLDELAAQHTPRGHTHG
ncbi:hypothetical protein ACFT7S_19290 [Streptomyces sp. NPDC057136]|uniref:hypothetical protein n=1 Tax=Streptomyces sp. NPDC057136 TaxID=3346029 RepID=UPI003638041F